MKSKRKCEICGKELNKTQKRFCSRKCYGLLNRGKNHPNWKDDRIIRYCIVCGKKFYSTSRAIKRGRGKFCSRRCTWDWISKNKRGGNHQGWKGGRIKRICKYCGKEFYVFPYYITVGWGKYCSRKCFGLSKRGKNSSAWRGGISFEPYGTDFNNELRERIRKRDNYTCQQCGYTEEQLGYKLHAHHIDYCKTHNEPENLILLCRSCHAQTNFSREDWIKYFQNKEIH